MGNIVRENSVFLFGNAIFENGILGFLITFLITVVIAKIFTTILEKLVDHAMKKDARASMPFKYLLKNNTYSHLCYCSICNLDECEASAEYFYGDTRRNECHDSCCRFSCAGNIW